jgi:DNA-binding GntR family transcriptional regulator
MMYEIANGKFLRPGGDNIKELKLTTGPTLSDQAYVFLRRSITEGDLTPGRRVTERGLASELGVSPTPVREAIRRLEHERLLERLDGRTLTVAQPSLHHLYQLNQIEAALRGVAARLAAESASDEELDEIKRTCDRAAKLELKTKTPNDILEVLRLTRSMHEHIDQASHSPVLLDMIATAAAFDWAVRIRAVELLGTSYSSEHPGYEHTALVEALCDRDGVLAESLMSAHVRSAGQRFLDVLARNGDGTEVGMAEG